MDDHPAPDLQGLVDLDLGFDDESWQLRRLAQRCERRSEREYWYESPATGYAAMLTVTADGFVRDYPGLWTAE